MKKGRGLGMALLLLGLSSYSGAEITRRAGVMYGPAGAAATLAAAGAFTAGSEQLVRDYHRAIIYCRYTRGAITGAVDIRVEFKADDGKWYRETVNNDSLTTSAPAWRTYTFTSTASGEQTFMLFVDDIYAQSIRVQAAESGVTATPGTFAVFGVFMKTQRQDAGGG